MRIAQVAPLTESVPPKTYGGIERVVNYLTEELVHQGHEVTLFASGDSLTTADLVAVVDRSLRLSEQEHDAPVWHMRQLMEVIRMANKFDIIHFHTDYSHFPVCRLMNTPHVTTLHGRLDMPSLQIMFDEFKDMPVVSISDAQRRPLLNAGYVATVYNGTPKDRYLFNPHPGDYLAFLGRYCVEKGPVAAIQIANRVGMPLKMAAKVDRVDRDYFTTEVQPHLDDRQIKHIGEVDDKEKVQLLSGARALLFPIDWPEPFGLVMIEAMACGTPVIAFRRGSVEEVIKDGVTGYIVDSVDEAVAALKQIDRIDRLACRKHFEKHFSTQRMTEQYLQVYSQLMQKTDRRPSPSIVHG